MNRTELIDRIAIGANISFEQASRSLDTIINSIVGTLKRGDKVMLLDFGTFHVAKRKVRTVLLPGTSSEPIVPAVKVARFTSGMLL
jgi:DNA-binding protein HU-beta